MSSENRILTAISWLVFSDLQGHGLSPHALGVRPIAAPAMVFLKNVGKYCNDRFSWMPSPVGHALGGLVAAFVVDAFARRPHLTLPILAASAVMSVAPDLDLLAFSHRTHTHSIGAVALVGVVTWLFLRARHS